MFNRNGQSLLEYAILTIIIIAALLTMQVYIKRGFQGRWKSAVDDLGDQYDARLVNSQITHSMVSSSSTEVRTMREGGSFVTASDGGDPTATKRTPGVYTIREDETTSTDIRDGFIKIGVGEVDFLNKN